MEVRRLTWKECYNLPDSGVRKWVHMLVLPFLMVGVSVIYQIVTPPPQDRAGFIGYLAGGVVFFMLAMLLPGIKRGDEYSVARAEKKAHEQERWGRASVAAEKRLEAKRDPDLLQNYRNERLAVAAQELVQKLEAQDLNFEAKLVEEMAYRLTGGERVSWIDFRRREESDSAPQSPQ